MEIHKMYQNISLHANSWATVSLFALIECQDSDYAAECQDSDYTLYLLPQIYHKIWVYFGLW